MMKTSHNAQEQLYLIIWKLMLMEVIGLADDVEMTKGVRTVSE